MKRNRILSLFTVLCLLLALLPAGALPASAEDAPQTVLVGVISYLRDELGDNFHLRYWGGADGAQDAELQDTGISIRKSLGSDCWSNEPQLFSMFTAEIPADAAGFKVYYHDPYGTYADRWFGGDGSTADHDRVFVFNYSADRALYASPTLTVSTAADWAAFAQDLELGVDFAGKTVTLTADVAVTVPAGSQEHPFRGCFEGGGHTLNVDIHAEDWVQGAAPFRAISDGAVIRNLTAAGTVYAEGYHAGGLVGFSMGGSEDSPNTIENCTVDVAVSGCSYSGGVVGHGTDSRLTVTGTVCSGALCADSYSGGLQGWGDSNCLTLSDCLFCGSYSGTGTFDPVAIGYGDLSCEDVYYTAEPVSSYPPGPSSRLTSMVSLR